MRATRAHLVPSVRGVTAPPEIGSLLPRADRAIEVRRKLLGYSLNPKAKEQKARGFSLLLGIARPKVTYLEGAIQTGILVAPVSSIRATPPWGLNCVVEVPVRGLGRRQDRVLNVRTVWKFDSDGATPRLVSAFVKP